MSAFEFVHCKRRLIVTRLTFNNLICLTNSIMERYTIEQRVKIVEAFYENGRSIQNALRDFFGQHNRPNVSRDTLGNFSKPGLKQMWKRNLFVLRKTLLLFAIVWQKSRLKTV